ncbi:hypothetical protein [Cognatishimia activa]|uniref:hypothetical protein n=1 Tax=Cognatishimia activa TaxID=1715691 RepID=UPI00222ED211|nr:hypothetical protein [Cognatishimia activa]UZD91722.1 hypothetical protein M0D42_03640 [Cognatishimia activa]
MQQLEGLQGSGQIPMHGQFRWSKSHIFGAIILCGLAYPENGKAKDINTLAANANCDRVTIKQAAREPDAADSEKVDWLAINRMQREYTGQELLPEHFPDEPQHDTVTGCAIKNDEHAAGVGDSDLEDVQVAEMEFVGWAKNAAVAQEAQEEVEHDGVVRLQSKMDEPETDIIRYLTTEASLIVRCTSILLLTAIAVAVAFGLRFVFKIIIGLMQRRRVCHIPCSLVTTNQHVIEGHMTVIGLRSFRFVPVNQDEMTFFKKTLDEPEMFYFSVHVGDLEFEVFVDGIRGYYSPVAFDDKLTPKIQKQILEYSTIAPKIGQLIVVPYNVKKHKAHIKNRANNTVYIDERKVKGADKNLGHSSIRKALRNARIGFSHST